MGTIERPNDGAPNAERWARRSRVAVIVAARDEGERIGATLAALAAAFPAAALFVADDGSRDDTARVAAAAGGARWPRPGAGAARARR